MIPKTKQLIQLVEDKTLLREAPLVRDLILQLYNFDIDDSNNKRESTDVPGQCPIYERWKIVTKFATLVRYVRERSAPVLNEYPKYNFWIVQDENKKRRVVHIKKGLNQDYILKNLKHIEKLDEARESLQTRIRLYKTTPPLTKEEIEEQKRENVQAFLERTIDRRKETLMRNYCLRKHIKHRIKELRQVPWSPEPLPQELKWSQTRIDSNFGLTTSVHDEPEDIPKIQIQIEKGRKYKPNFKGIQHIFIQHATEMYLETIDPNNKGDEQSNIDPRLLNRMLKEIILCDYQNKDYQRLDRNEEMINAGKEKIKRYWLRDLI